MTASIDMLTGHGVTMLFELRAGPRSRPIPQDDREKVPEALAPFAIDQTLVEGQGGFRPTPFACVTATYRASRARTQRRQTAPAPPHG